MIFILCTIRVASLKVRVSPEFLIGMRRILRSPWPGLRTRHLGRLIGPGKPAPGRAKSFGCRGGSLVECAYLPGRQSSAPPLTVHPSSTKKLSGSKCAKTLLNPFYSSNMRTSIFWPPRRPNKERSRISTAWLGNSGSINQSLLSEEIMSLSGSASHVS